MSESLAIPAIHNNGTSKKELVDNLKEVYSSLREALNKLRKTAPHMRDYYTNQNNDYEIAEVQFNNRYCAIVKVMNELQQIAIAIQTNER